MKFNCSKLRRSASQSEGAPGTSRSLQVSRAMVRCSFNVHPTKRAGQRHDGPRLRHLQQHGGHARRLRRGRRRGDGGL